MKHKLLSLIILLFISLNLASQDGHFSGSFSIGLADHSVYKVFDDGDKVGIGTNKYFWKMGQHQTSKFTFAASYYFKKVRLDANFIFNSEFYIDNNWQNPITNIGIFSRGSNIASGGFNVILYQNNANAKARFKINPGIGFGIIKIDLLDQNNPGSGGSSTFTTHPWVFSFSDSYLNKTNYQLIAAIEMSIGLKNNKQLFLNTQYQFGILKMYERDFSYRPTLSTEEFTAKVLYNGSNVNFNVGMRWHFGDTTGYNIIE